jgi:putative transcriptional regulator
MKPSCVADLKPLDIKKIRARLDHSQSECALIIGVSVATFQNWEQGRRKPEGPAQALLKFAASSPKVVARALGVPLWKAG